MEHHERVCISAPPRSEACEELILTTGAMTVVKTQVLTVTSALPTIPECSTTALTHYPMVLYH